MINNSTQKPVHTSPSREYHDQPSAAAAALAFASSPAGRCQRRARTPDGDGRGRTRETIRQKRLAVSRACAKPKVRRWVDDWGRKERCGRGPTPTRPDEEASGGGTGTGWRTVLRVRARAKRSSDSQAGPALALLPSGGLVAELERVESV